MELSYTDPNNMRLRDLIRDLGRWQGGGTDCSAPLRWAASEYHAEPRVFDAVVILTDNETWAGHGHVVEHLAAYRQRTGLPVKLISCALTATRGSVADAADAHCLNLVGLDANVVPLLTDFLKS
jgi:60 kDa SS-A/Ro ribonucleoprotein